MKQSIIVPHGMTEFQVLNMGVYEEKWIEMPEYQCVSCGRSAYRNPYTDARWGCKRCGFTGSFDSCSTSRMFRFNPNQFISLARKQGMLGYGKDTMRQIVFNPCNFTVGVGMADGDEKSSAFIFRRQGDTLTILVFMDKEFDSREKAVSKITRLLELFLDRAMETLNDSAVDWNSALSTGIIVLIEDGFKRHDIVRTNDFKIE